jgi:GNAT superfamily N-acetyltransferase
MHVRRCETGDRSRIWQVRHGTAENRLLDPALVQDAEVDWYQQHAIFLVSEDAEGVQGFLCANHQTSYIWALFVIDGKQGSGHGLALLTEAERQLRVIGHRQVFLTTGPGTRAEQWYQRRGFRLMGRSFSGECVLVKAL